jgi:hypothetical protein
MLQHISMLQHMSILHIIITETFNNTNKNGTNQSLYFKYFNILQDNARFYLLTAVLLNISSSVMLNVMIGEDTQAFQKIVAPSSTMVCLSERTLKMKAPQVSETSPTNNPTAHHIHQKT